MSAPPAPLIALFGILIFYVYLSSYFSIKHEYRRTKFNMKLLLLVLPALLFFIMRHNDSSGRWYVLRFPRPNHDSIYRAGGSPWGVALLLLLLFLMISYHSSLASLWFRPLWYSHYY
ncbi:hypothetical protein RND81_01G000600 [Saponaria officinalis]|uniref:Uncharacterized protein n=1 Tax=Saponaria officinalis TaxID=3572 RepID=A0AAW1NEX2_SAPOF